MVYHADPSHELGSDTLPVGVSEFCLIWQPYTGFPRTERPRLHTLHSNTVSSVFMPPRKAAVAVRGTTAFNRRGKEEFEAKDSEWHYTLIKALNSLKYHPAPIWNSDDLTCTYPGLWPKDSQESG
jgi:hypothetical protein